MSFYCERCCKYFKRKENLDNHLNKKNACELNTVGTLLKEANIDHHELLEFLKTKEEYKNINMDTDIDDIIENKFKDYICFFCDKKFVNKQNAQIHFKNNCKQKKIIKDELEKKRKLKENDKLKQIEEQNKK